MTCGGVLFTPPVGCSRLPSAVKDLATTIFIKMSSNSFHSTATMKYWKRRMPPLVVMKRNWFTSLFSRFAVETVILVTAVRKSDRSFIGAVLPDLFSEIKSVFSYISHTPQRMGNRSGLLVPIYPSRWTSPRSNQFRVANHDLLNLIGSDREFHLNSF